MTSVTDTGRILSEFHAILNQILICFTVKVSFLPFAFFNEIVVENCKNGMFVQHKPTLA